MVPLYLRQTTRSIALFPWQCKPMATYKQLLHQAVDQYSDVLKQTSAIEDALTDMQAPMIDQLARQLGQSMEKARAIDLEINAGSHPADDSDINWLFASRRALMEEILNKTKELEPRIQGIRALQRSEMKKIKQGRQTATGYAQHLRPKTGRIINSSK